MKEERADVEKLVTQLRRQGYSNKAIREIMKWYMPKDPVGTSPTSSS